jgi:hypothetical protein
MVVGERLFFAYLLLIGTISFISRALPEPRFKEAYLQTAVQIGFFSMSIGSFFFGFALDWFGPRKTSLAGKTHLKTK